jgi:Na+-driven multidrug efflux pump
MELIHVSSWEEAKEQMRYALPISFTTVCRLLVGTTATAFLGHISTNDLAAAGLANVINDVFGVFVGAAGYTIMPLCGQAWGAGNKPILGVWLQIAIVVMAFMCAIFTPIIIFSTEPFLKLCGINDTVTGLAGQYVRVYVFTMFPLNCFMALRVYLQTQGSVQPSMYVCIVASVVNVVLNYVTIYILHMGLQGPAIATLLTSTLQVLLFVIGPFIGVHRQISMLFTHDAEVLDYIETVSNYFVCAVLLTYFSMDIMCVLDGVGRPNLSGWLALGSTFAFELPGCYIFGFRMNMNVRGLWTACIVSESMRLLLGSVVVARLDWDAEAIAALKRSEVETEKSPQETDPLINP